MVKIHDTEKTNSGRQITKREKELIKAVKKMLPFSLKVDDSYYDSKSDSYFVFVGYGLLKGFLKTLFDTEVRDVQVKGCYLEDKLVGFKICNVSKKNRERYKLAENVKRVIEKKYGGRVYIFSEPY